MTPASAKQVRSRIYVKEKIYTITRSHMIGVESLENDNPQPYYDPYQQKAACNKTMIYCIVSIALLIASGAVTHPDVIAVLPGGTSTSSILSFLIIVSVFLLCFWQRPRPIK